MGELVKLLRVGVVGAAGVLGRELLAALTARKLPVLELVPIGSEGSAGDGVEFLGEDLPLRPPDTELAGLDAVFVCAPAEEALGYVRRALRARVPCLDLSGALARSEDVPLLDALDADAAEAAPVVSVAGGAALALARVLRALEAEAPLVRAQATVLESTSAAGRQATEALSGETISLLNQQEPDDEEPGPLPWPIAFDCHAASDEADLAGRSGREDALAAAVGRLVARPLPLDCTVLRVPTFTGEGIALSVAAERPLDPAEVAARLAKVPGLEVVAQDRGGLRTRASTGRENVLVGRIRAAADGAGLLLWLAADTQRLTALNAVDLAGRLLAGAPAGTRDDPE